CLSGSYDGTVRLWDLETGREVQRLRGHSDRVRSVAVSPDGQQMLSGGCDQTLRLWDVQTGREVHRFRRHSHWVIHVAFSPDGRRAISGSLDGTVRLWSVRTGREVGGIGGSGVWDRFKTWMARRDAGTGQGQRPNATSVALAPDGRRALTGSTDRTL